MSLVSSYVVAVTKTAILDDQVLCHRVNISTKLKSTGRGDQLEPSLRRLGYATAGTTVVVLQIRCSANVFFCSHVLCNDMFRADEWQCLSVHAAARSNIAWTLANGRVRAMLPLRVFSIACLPLLAAATATPVQLDTRQAPAGVNVQCCDTTITVRCPNSRVSG